MTDEHANILVIMGSVRSGRRCPEIADWVLALLRERPALRCERIDLRDWALPPDDEPAIPATGRYATSHTRAWSGKVAAARGIVIVTPQYNWGYPAALKNALDHLYAEWGGKPLLVITYGGHGGGKCAEQLRQIATGLKMLPLATMPAITLTRETIEGGLPTTGDALRPYEAALRQGLAELQAALAEPT